MNLSHYIDNHIIREHAIETRAGLSLDVVDIDKYSLGNIIDYLVEHDPATKEIILDHVQDLIDARLPLLESKRNYDRGLKPIHDNQTGEVRWTARGGY